MARLSQRNLVSDSRCWAVHPGQPADRAMNASGLRPMSSNRGDGGHEQANEQDEIFEFLPGVASLMEDLDSKFLKNSFLIFCSQKEGVSSVMVSALEPLC